MFPTLDPAEIERLRRFGETRTYGAGERVVATGEISPGAFVILSGEVAITQHRPLGRDQAIVTHGPGSLMGELAQLSGRPLAAAHGDVGSPGSSRGTVAADEGRVFTR